MTMFILILAIVSFDHPAAAAAAASDPTADGTFLPVASTFQCGLRLSTGNDPIKLHSWIYAFNVKINGAVVNCSCHIQLHKATVL